MKKNALYFGIAALALLVVSCSKGNEMDTLDNQERVTMIDPWTAIDQSPYKLPLVSGPKVSITAGFEENGETKTTMDVGTSYAKVLWTSGDEFKMYAWEGSGYYEVPFTTTGSGEKVDFSATSGTPSVSPWYFIYGVTPDAFGYDGDNMLFRIHVPSDQFAVANKVKDDYLYSYAQTTEGLSSNVCFKSMLAFVRFKMSGTIASSVTSVTLTGASYLAGHSVLVPAADGTPQMSFSIDFGGDVRSSTVTLEGPFAADTYYYFAVVPGTQSSFSLTFSGATGSVTKVSKEAVTFTRGTITDLQTINVGDTFPAAPSMETIKWNTASVAGDTKPVTIAVVPDGFTASEMDKYEMLANAAMNTLFSVEPFKSYKNYFNVYILKVASGASGARITDGTDAEQNRDCYFESAWKKNSYSDMAANDVKLFNYVTDHCPDITSINASTVYHTIKEVPVLMIINDTRYGGKNWSYSTGEAYCMAPYTDSGGRLSWSYPDEEAVSDSNPAEGTQVTPSSRYTEVGSNTGNWLNTMVHEFGGHCFARLKDEYWYDSPKSVVEHIDTYKWPVKFGLNVSATYSNPGKDTGDYAADGWQFLLNEKSTLAASNPLYNRIGVYQGADVSILNRWRSERISCMIDNRFYFSTFQRYLIVKRIMSLAGVTFENEAAFWAAFKAKDVPIDPVRDLAGSLVMGESDPVPPRPVPLLPPPGLVEVK